VRLVPLTSLLAPTSEIYVLKVDTEGHELRVLQGALPFFEQHSIRHAFVEFTPELWPRLLYRYTIVTLFLHCSHTVVTLTGVALMHSAVTILLHSYICSNLATGRSGAERLEEITLHRF
jgi:hypothetical protein